VYTYEHKKIIEKIFIGIFKNYFEGISEEKNIWRNIGGTFRQYFWKEFEGITGEIFIGHFEENFGENIDHIFSLLRSTCK
jgi:hypothetical protein